MAVVEIAPVGFTVFSLVLQQAGGPCLPRAAFFVPAGGVLALGAHLALHLKIDSGSRP